MNKILINLLKIVQSKNIRLQMVKAGFKENISEEITDVPGNMKSSFLNTLQIML